MANPKLGKKHKCHSCGASYYDLNKAEITCPKCGKAPKKRSASEAIALAEPDIEDPEVADDLIETDLNGNEIESLEELAEEEGISDDHLDDDEENGLIADASDLGVDEDDMSEVMEHIDEDVVDPGE